MPRFVKADSLLKTHDATPGDIAFALHNGVKAYLSTNGTPITSLDELMNSNIEENGCTVVIFHVRDPKKPHNLANFDKRPDGYLRYLCIDVEAFEEVTGKKAVEKDKINRNKNQEKATDAASKRADKKYIKDQEVTAILLQECIEHGEPQTTEMHRLRWNELQTGNKHENVREDSFRAFRRTLPASLKYEDPAKK
jgi:hypothetical protein